jgi:hypothetical protein
MQLPIQRSMDSDSRIQLCIHVRQRMRQSGIWSHSHGGYRKHIKSQNILTFVMYIHFRLFFASCTSVTPEKNQHPKHQPRGTPPMASLVLQSREETQEGGWAQTVGADLEVTISRIFRPQLPATWPPSRLVLGSPCSGASPRSHGGGPWSGVSPM